MWLVSISAVVWDTIKTMTVNRTKLMVRFDSILAVWGNMMTEAGFIDRKFRFDNALDDERIQWITYWTMCFTTQYMDLHMILLIEMNLLNIDELAYFYWYWDYINSSRCWTLDRMNTLRYELSMIYYMDDMKTGNDKKKKINKPIPIEPDIELLMIQAKGNLCKGLFRLFITMNDIGIIQQRDSIYTTPSFRFLQRFRAFQNICNPPLLQYNEYIKTIENGKENNEDIDIFKVINNANKCFGITKLIMDKIRQSYCNDNDDNDEKNTIDEILRKSIIPLTKVSIASNVNTIRMEQLLKTMKNGNSKVDPLLLNFSLDRSHSHHYPIVEIKKK
jgi:hypothetical protein